MHIDASMAVMLLRVWAARVAPADAVVRQRRVRLIVGPMPGGARPLADCVGDLVDQFGHPYAHGQRVAEMRLRMVRSICEAGLRFALKVCACQAQPMQCAGCGREVDARL